MKKLEKILTVGGFVIGVSLVGFGCYRDDHFPEKDNINSLLKGTGLALFSLGTGLTLKKIVDYEDKKYFEEHKKLNYKS